MERRTTKPLRPADLGFGLLFEATPDAVLSVDLGSGRIVLANPAAARLFGWSRDELVGMRVTDLMPPRLRGAHEVGLRRYRESGEGALVDRATPTEMPAVRRDGEEIWVELTLTSLGQEREREVVTAILRDVTERRRLLDALARERARQDATLERLRVANARLLSVNRDLEDFTRTVTHDLVEPLRGVEVMSRFLADEPDLSEDGRDLARRLRGNAERLRDMVRRALDVSRATRGEEPSEAVDAADALARVIERLEGAARERDATVEAAPDGLPVVHASRAALEAVLQNLVSNAIKHSPVGVRVRVAAEDAGDAWRFTVDDSGPGVPPQERERVFDLFRRGASAAEGHGIGLATVRRFVARLGGEVGVGDAPALGGARFWFTVPKAAA